MTNTILIQGGEEKRGMRGGRIEASAMQTAMICKRLYKGRVLLHSIASYYRNEGVPYLH